MNQPLRARIEVLPQAVIDKIAAGEVVERPASVLKELIENSIDANSSKIEITVQDSGFSLIKITDNGSGIPQDDLPRSLLPHATSKIHSAEDLYAIATMGFRGEALASIAAVSRMTITSSVENDGLGFTISCDGGVQDVCKPTHHLKGTSISIRDLFYNVPARKKFMKSERSEHLALMRMFEQIIVPFPGIHFTASFNGESFDYPPVANPISRIASLAGLEFTNDLIECRNSRDGMDALLYMSSPEKLKQRPRYQSLYVNLRRIDNEAVSIAIRESFSQFLGGGYRPAFFCFLDIDPAKIDVNVHPTKQLVKFDNERELFSFIYGTVKHGIASRMTTSPDLRTASDTSLHESGAVNIMDSIPAGIQSHPGAQVQSYIQTDPANPGSPQNALNAPGAGSPQTILQFPSPSPEKTNDQSKENTIQLAKEGTDPWDLIQCYQIHGLYILAQIKHGILLIDQHAAHERVLYEQALEDIKQGRSASQQLLFPAVLELAPSEKAVLNSGLDYFKKFGFEISDFGGNSVAVSAMPAFLKNGLIEETIRGMLRYLIDGKNPELFTEPEKRFAAAFACGAAIKAGQKLSQEEMNALLNSLFSTGNPYICPHGRPTLVRISIDELSRRFLR